MRLTCVAVVLTCLLCPSASLAQQTPRFEDRDKAAIEELLNQYAEAFVAKDFVTLQQTIQAPFIRLAGNWDVLATIEDVIVWYRQQREALDQQNFAARATFLDSRMTVLAPDRALVNKTFRRYRNDGTVLADMAVLYVLIKSSGKWKLSGLINQDREYFRKAY